MDKIEERSLRKFSKQAKVESKSSERKNNEVIYQECTKQKIMES